MKNIYNYILILLIIFISISITKCNKYKNKSNKYQDSYRVIYQDYETFRTKQGDIITKQEIIITDNKKDIQKLLGDIKFLSKKKRTIETAIKYETSTIIDSIYIPYTDTFNNDTNINTIKYFRANNEYYTIIGKTMPKGVLFDSIYFPNKITIAIEQKGGIFYKNQTLYLNNSNKYTNNKNVQSVTLNKKPTRLNKGLSTALKVGVGILIGKTIL